MASGIDYFLKASIKCCLLNISWGSIALSCNVVTFHLEQYLFHFVFGTHIVVLHELHHGSVMRPGKNQGLQATKEKKYNR